MQDVGSGAIDWVRDAEKVSYSGGGETCARKVNNGAVSTKTIFGGPSITWSFELERDKFSGKLRNTSWPEFWIAMGIRLQIAESTSSVGFSRLGTCETKSDGNLQELFPLIIRLTLCFESK